MGENMKEHDGLMLNKYGALSVTELGKLYNRIIELETELDRMNSVLINLEIQVDMLGDVLNIGKNRVYMFGDKHCFDFRIVDLMKLKDNIKIINHLTHADDYEYITETKLVKKKGKEK